MRQVQPLLQTQLIVRATRLVLLQLLTIKCLLLFQRAAALLQGEALVLTLLQAVVELLQLFQLLLHGVDFSRQPGFHFSDCLLINDGNRFAA